jgi:raffinose/stachyose/melibiose transport system substrate-binding protein
MRKHRIFGVALILCAACVVVAAAALGGRSTKESAAANKLLGPMPTRPIDILVWTGAGGPWEDLAKQFMAKYPNVTVKVQRFDFNTAITKVTTAVAARKGPDVLGGPYANPDWDKALVPLNGYLTKSMRKRIQFLPLYEAQDNGSTYYLPYESYSYVWYYSKALFKKARLNPNSPPKTWNQLLGTCNALKTAGITPIAAGFKDGWLANWYIDFGFASQLITKDKIRKFYNPNIPAQKKIGWTNPLYKRAFGYLDTLNKRSCFTPNSFGLNYSDMIPDFVNHKAAMMYTVAGFPPFADVIKQSSVRDLGLFKMPTLPNSPYKSRPMDSGPNTATAITNFRPDRCRVSWEFVKFLYQPKQQMYLWTGGKGGDKNYPNLLGLPPLASKIPQERQILKWLQNPDNHGGFSPGVGGQTDPINRIETEMISGQKTVDEALEELEQLRLDNAKLQPPVKFKKSPVCR